MIIMSVADVDIIDVVDGIARKHRAMLLRPSRSNVPLLKTWPRQA